jgi:alkaline phosphatase D
MRTGYLLLLLVHLSASSWSQTTRIAFGSCAKQYHPLDIFDTILAHHPSHFIFLGDNIYADTEDKDLMCARYDSLAMKVPFQHLKDSTIIWATWDDHDYGANDAGKEYPQKEQSKGVFLDFFSEPVSSCRWKHAGIYTSYFLKENGLTIQFLVLDTRTFRDTLIPYDGAYAGVPGFHYTLEYAPNTDPTANLLGFEQWTWLEQELMLPADVRVICSSIQFAHSFNGFESWNNFPLEKQRMIDLIHCTDANGVVFISGDVHYGEISKNEIDAGYPLYDITSSGLSSKWHRPAPNYNRIAGPVMENNFGLLTIGQQTGETFLLFELIDTGNKLRSQLTIPLNELQLK